jgi:hypothetical protein
VSIAFSARVTTWWEDPSWPVLELRNGHAGPLNHLDLLLRYDPPPGEGTAKDREPIRLVFGFLEPGEKVHIDLPYPLPETVSITGKATEGDFNIGIPVRWPWESQAQAGVLADNRAASILRVLRRIERTEAVRDTRNLEKALMALNGQLSRLNHKRERKPGDDNELLKRARKAFEMRLRATLLWHRVLRPLMRRRSRQG